MIRFFTCGWRRGKTESGVLCGHNPLVPRSGNLIPPPSVGWSPAASGLKFVGLTNANLFLCQITVGDGADRLTTQHLCEETRDCFLWWTSGLARPTGLGTVVVTYRTVAPGVWMAFGGFLKIPQTHIPSMFFTPVSTFCPNPGPCGKEYRVNSHSGSNRNAMKTHHVTCSSSGRSCGCASCFFRQTSSGTVARVSVLVRKLLSS